jgi:hypothetical protein
MIHLTKERESDAWNRINQTVTPFGQEKIQPLQRYDHYRKTVNLKQSSPQKAQNAQKKSPNFSAFVLLSFCSFCAFCGQMFFWLKVMVSFYPSFCSF